MDDNVGKLFVDNGTLKPCSDMPESIDEQAGPVYEVIRVMKGVPLFFEDHIERMSFSLTQMGNSAFFSQAAIKADIQRLVTQNGNADCNVKIIASGDGTSSRLFMYISKSHYPSREEIAAGVKTGLVRLKRLSPNVKRLNKAYREKVAEVISKNGFFEVLLVDDSDCITEGSKSNLFFVKGGTVVTPPGEAVLKGITRKYVLEAVDRLGVKVTEERVEASGITAFDGLFLSGTSIKVLPVASVDRMQFASAQNALIGAISREYDALLQEYINKNSSKT